ncbi:hypothetical protein CU098_011037 [Rhizopus stolonifer]|uniref:Pyrroloquinoline quinone-dependent pyranose dehydrogenase beta-propeller domain-containing protein n=1 Tax=Rhizopus stolonifer TaxID=4846 RepID=A0A367KPP2_RHIST|nr:hypothetical protein CU098_011037 [Rhizopus stolonifer]
MKNTLILFLLAFCVTLALAKQTQQELEEAELKASQEEDERVKAAGALLVGSSGILVPDASADKPMILDNKKDQPLCKPDTTLSSSRPLKVMDGFELTVLVNSIPNPHKIMIDKANHVLVISPGNGVYSVRMDDCSNASVEKILDSQTMDQPIGQSMAIFGGHLYVTTTNSIYQFPYSDGQHSSLLEGRLVMTNIQSDAIDIAVDPFGHAFVSRSVGEIHDKLDAFHGIIKKFNLKLIPQHGFDYERHGEMHAYGTNTYGSMGFDTQARLWGLNGLSSSEITRDDINLAANGLAEELNLYEFSKMNYGFPYCMTEYNLAEVSASAAKGLGGQWAHPIFMNDSVSLDDYCQQEVNNKPPSVPLAPNSLAVSVHFYLGTFCSMGDSTTMGTSVGLPCNWTDTPILANHGIDGQPAGHNVVRLPFDDLGHKPRWDKEPEVILEQAEPCNDNECLSPNGLAVDKYGRLFVTSDKTNEILVVSRIYSERAIHMLTDKYEEEAERIG